MRATTTSSPFESCPLRSPHPLDSAEAVPWPSFHSSCNRFCRGGNFIGWSLEGGLRRAPSCSLRAAPVGWVACLVWRKRVGARPCAHTLTPDQARNPPDRCRTERTRRSPTEAPFKRPAYEVAPAAKSVTRRVERRPWNGFSRIEGMRASQWAAFERGGGGGGAHGTASSPLMQLFFCLLGIRNLLLPASPHGLAW